LCPLAYRQQPACDYTFRYWGQCVGGGRMNIRAAPKTMRTPERWFVVLKCVYKVPASSFRCEMPTQVLYTENL
jgi:hypothetical protein